MRNSLLSALCFLAAMLYRETAASTVTPVSVPISKVVFDSKIIVIASIESVAIVQRPEPKKNDRGLRCLEVRIEESPESA